jgi:biopolymer transport protein ExbD
MARPKIARKSTSIDMTAMCDVAFLLLSFFILTTKFKSSQAVEVSPPSSVSAQVATEKDYVLVSINSNGRVYLSVDDPKQREQIAAYFNSTKKLGLNEQKFAQAEFFGAPFSGLAQTVSLPKEQQTDKYLPGIPTDTTKGSNELIDWMAAVKNVYTGKKMTLLLKGDNVSKYPAFKGVIAAFKKNEFLKFQMVTSPENAPEGTDLYNSRKSESKP